MDNLEQTNAWDADLAHRALVASAETALEWINDGRGDDVLSNLTLMAKNFGTYMRLAQDKHPDATRAELIWSWRRLLSDRYRDSSVIHLWCLLEEGSRDMAAIPEPVRSMVREAVHAAGLTIRAPDGMHRSARD
jgi:hypothetical protein